MACAASPDTIVVGAGVIGAAVAYVLAEERCSVLVLDRAFPGAGTTGSAMGHIVAMEESDALRSITSYSSRLLDAVLPELPESCEVSRCGTLWLARSEAELRLAEKKRERLMEVGVEAELIGQADARRLEPRLRTSFAGALRVPGDSVVYPPGLAQWFLERARERGVRFRSANVRGLEPGRVVVDGATLRSGNVVNAAGPWSPSLTPGLPVAPLKGHLAITARYPGFCRHQLVELGYLDSVRDPDATAVAFNLQPRTTGQVMVGSSREMVGWDPEVNRETLGAMLARAIEYVPDLARLDIVRTWTGFRPATPTGLPLVGSWPEADGVWIATGHEGLGVTTALGSARLLVDLMLGRTPSIDPVPFLPVRAEGAVGS